MRPRAGFRLGLAGLMALIGAIAAEFGLMRSGSDGAVAIAYAVLLLALAVGLLGAIVRRGAGPWVGLSLFGWGYALLAFTPAVKVCDVPRLPTIGMVEWAAGRLREDSLRSFQRRLSRLDGDLEIENGLSRKKTKGGQLVPLSPGEQKIADEAVALEMILMEDNQKSARGEFTNVQWIGHSTLTLLVAALGAAIGRALDPRRAVVATVVEGGMPR